MIWKSLLLALLIHGFLQEGGPPRPANTGHLAVAQASQSKGGAPAMALESLPPSVQEILKGDHTVKSCLEKRQFPADRLPASWFSTSHIRLAGPEGDDLLVQPTSIPETSGCFHGVECCAWFWVFRQVGSKYELVLKVFAGALGVRNTTWKGFRIIEATSGNAKGFTTVSFRFEGSSYKQFRKRTTYRDQ